MTDMGQDLLTALALLLIIEGVLPLLMPGRWREMYQRLLAMNDGQLRFVGLISLAAGLLILLLS